MLNRDFKEFAELLNARGVEYLVMGSYALAAHGHPRCTGDIDFWVRPSGEAGDGCVSAAAATWQTLRPSPKALQRRHAHHRPPARRSRQA